MYMMAFGALGCSCDQVKPVVVGRLGQPAVQNALRVWLVAIVVGGCAVEVVVSRGCERGSSKCILAVVFYPCTRCGNRRE